MLSNSKNQREEGPHPAQKCEDVRRARKKAESPKQLPLGKLEQGGAGSSYWLFDFFNGALILLDDIKLQFKKRQAGIFFFSVTQSLKYSNHKRNTSIYNTCGI